MADDFQGFEDLLPKGKAIPKADFSGFEDLLPIPGADLLSRAAPAPVAQPVSLQGIPTSSVVGGAPAAPALSLDALRPEPTSMAEVVSRALELTKPTYGGAADTMKGMSAGVDPRDAEFLQAYAKSRNRLDPGGPERPVTALMKTPTGQAFAAVPERPVRAARRAAPDIRTPSVSPITGRESFIPFREGPPSIADVAAEVAPALGRGTRQLGLQWLGGITSPADLATGQSVTGAVRQGLKDIQAESRVAQAKTIDAGNTNAVVQAMEGLPQSAAFMGAFSSRLPMTAAMMLMQPDAAQDYHRYRQLGNDPLAAFVASQGGALAQVLPERIAWETLVHLFKLPKGSTKTEFLKRLGIQQTGEHLEEQISAVANYAIDKSMKDPTATPARLWQDMKQAFQQTAITAPVLGGGALVARHALPIAERIAERLSPGAALGQALEKDVAGADFPSTAAAAAGATLPQNAQLVQTPAGRAAEPRPYTPGQPVTVPPTEAYRAPQIRIEPQNRESERVGINPQIPQDRIDRNLAPGLGQEGAEAGRSDQSGSSAPVGRQDVMLGVLARGQESEVVDSVVRAIPVDVVNVLGGEQRAAQELLHDPSVFTDLFSVDDQGLVTPKPLDEVGARLAKRGYRLPYNLGVREARAAAGAEARGGVAIPRGGERRAAEAAVEHAMRVLSVAGQPVAGVGTIPSGPGKGALERLAAVETGGVQAPESTSDSLRQGEEEQALTALEQRKPLSGYSQVAQRFAGKDGKIVGMKGSATAQDVRRIGRVLERSVIEGIAGKDWYDHSGRRLMEWTEQQTGSRDPVLAERIIQMIAITSDGASVKSQWAFMHNALAQFARGEPIKVGKSAVNQHLNDLLYFGIPWDGRKTNQFYQNLMEGAGLAIDAHGATIDRHMMTSGQGLIAGGKGSGGAPTARGYDLMEALVQEVAKKLGLTVRGAQAAAWIVIKRDKLLAQWKKNGIHKDLTPAQRSEKALQEGLVDFGVMMVTRPLPFVGQTQTPSAQTLTQTHAVPVGIAPSPSTPEGKAITQLSLGKQLQYRKIIRRIIEEYTGKTGRVSRIAQLFGLDRSQVTQTISMGSFEGALDPNIIYRFSGTVSENDISQFRYALMYVLGQKAAGYFRADPALRNDAKATAGMKLQLAKPLTNTQLKAMLADLNAVDKQLHFTILDTGDVAILNWTNLSTEDFDKKVVDFLAQNAAKYGLGPEAIQFGAKGDYQDVNTWTQTDTTGEILSRASEGRRPDLQAGLERLRSTVTAATEQFLNEHAPGWRGTEQSSAQGDNGALAQAGGRSQAVARETEHQRIERETSEILKRLNEDNLSTLHDKLLGGELSGGRGLLAEAKRLLLLQEGSAKDLPTLKTDTASNLGFTGRKHLNGLRPLTPKENQHLASALAAADFPKAIAESVTWVVNDGARDSQGTFFTSGIVAIEVSRFRDDDLMWTVAHELTHSIDLPPDKRARDINNQDFSSSRTDRTSKVKGEPMGDLTAEAVLASANNEEIKERFRYPFDWLDRGDMTEEVFRMELTAQIGALYFQNPSLLEREMPTWFAIMEQTYGSQTKGIPEPRSPVEANERLHNALQNQDPIGGRQGGIGFAGSEIGYGADTTAVSARGPPTSGVGSNAPGSAIQQGTADERGGYGGPDTTAGAVSMVGSDTESAGAFEQRRALSATERAALRAAIARGIAPPPTIPTVPGGPPHGHGSHWDIDEPGLRDRFVRHWQDNKVDLKKVEEAITSFGGVMREDTMAYLYDELNQDRAITRVKRFVQNGVEPLMDSIKETGLSLDDVGDYLWAKHAAEANAHLSRINPGGATNLSGMYNNKAAAVAAGEPNALNAQDVMRDLLQPLNPQQRTALTQVEQQVHAITKATRQLMVSEGLENQSTINAWEAAYKNYVPLFRDIDATPGVGNSLIVKGPESKRRTGSKREAKAILAAVLSQHAKTIFRAEKAKVGRALVKLAELNPNADFWKVDTPPTKTFFDPNMGIVRTMVDPLYKNQDNVFVVKERDATGNVVERSITFNKGNERAVALAHAMRSLDAVQLQGATKYASMVNRFFGNLATQWNPYFWVTNPIRDYRDMVINLQSTPLKGQAGLVTAKIPQALAGVASAEFHDGQGTWAKMYREYEDEGGAIGWANVYGDITEEQAHLGTLMKEMHQGNMDPRKWGRMSLEMIDKVNRVMESATRVSVYAQAKEHFLKQGFTPELARAKAASLAKNITVNFRRKGNNSAATNAWFLFFNARVQGTATMIRALRDPRVMAIVGVLTAFSAALEILNRLTGDKDRDEDGNNPYDLIPEFVKQTNTILMLPAGDKSTSANEIKNAKGDVVGRYVSIPEPYGYNLFSTVGRLTAQAVMQHAMPDTTTRPKTAGTYATDLLHVALSTFVPFSTSGSAFQTVSPTVLSPVVQRLENKTWYGAPLRPEPLPFEAKGVPNWRLYFRTQSEMSKDLARFLSDTTGGDEVKSGALDLSPSDLSLIFTTLTGGTGRFGLEMFNFGKHQLAVANNEAQPGDLPYRQVPFVGKVFGETTDREAAAKFYEIKDQAVEFERQQKEYKALGEKDKAAQIEKDYPEYLAFAKEIEKKAYKKENQKINKELKNLDPAQSMAEREKEKKTLMEEHADLIANALTAYNDARRARLGAR